MKEQLLCDVCHTKIGSLIMAVPQMQRFHAMLYNILCPKCEEGDSK